MAGYVDEDLRGAEFRECDLTGARLIGVVMRDVVIDGLVTNVVVNGVEVTEYVEAELDRRHPVRVLMRAPLTVYAVPSCWARELNAA